MPLMRLACTALERVPLTRPKVIDYLMQKFNQDLVFCRAPDDNDLTSVVHGMLFLHLSDYFSFELFHKRRHVCVFYLFYLRNTDVSLCTISIISSTFLHTKQEEV